MLGRVVRRERYLRVGHHLRRVEHPEPEARLEEPLHGAVDLGLRDQPLLHGGDERTIGVAALDVSPSLQGHGRGFLGGLHEVVALVDVPDCAAVGDDVAAKIPLAPQYVNEQMRVRAARLAVRAVVGAHD